jgi:hypothetical protein
VLQALFRHPKGKSRALQHRQELRMNSLRGGGSRCTTGLASVSSRCCSRAAAPSPSRASRWRSVRACGVPGLVRGGGIHALPLRGETHTQLVRAPSHVPPPPPHSVREVDKGDRLAGNLSLSRRLSPYYVDSARTYRSPAAGRQLRCRRTTSPAMVVTGSCLLRLCGLMLPVGAPHAMRYSYPLCVCRPPLPLP